MSHKDMSKTKYDLTISRNVHHSHRSKAVTEVHEN